MFDINYLQDSFPKNSLQNWILTSKLDLARVKIRRVVNASCTRCRVAFRSSRKSPHPVMMSRDLP